MATFLIRAILILSAVLSGTCTEPLDTSSTNFSSNNLHKPSGNDLLDMIWQFIWPISKICSTGCILETVIKNSSNANFIQGLNHSGCVECVPWGGAGQLSPFTAALLALVSFGGAEYCYTGFWMLCGIKGGTFFVVFSGAMFYRLQGVPTEGVEKDVKNGRCGLRGGVLLHSLLLLISVVLLAWDILNVMATLDLFGGEEGWTFGQEACGKP